MSYFEDVTNFFKPNVKAIYSIEEQYNYDTIQTYKNNLYVQSIHYYLTHLSYEHNINIDYFVMNHQTFKYDRITNQYTMHIDGDSKANYLSLHIILDDNLNESVYNDSYRFKNYLENNILNYLNKIKDAIDEKRRILTNKYESLKKELNTHIHSYKNKYIENFQGKKFDFKEQENNFILDYDFRNDNLLLKIRNGEIEKYYTVNDGYFNHYLTYDNFAKYESMILNKKIDRAIDIFIENTLENEMEKVLLEKFESNKLKDIQLSFDYALFNDNDFTITIKPDTAKTIVMKVNLTANIDMVMKTIQNIRNYPMENFTNLKTPYNLHENVIHYTANEEDIKEFINYKHKIDGLILNVIMNPTYEKLEEVVAYPRLKYLLYNIYQSDNYTFDYNGDSYTVFYIRRQYYKDKIIAFKNKEKITFKEIKKIKKKYIKNQKKYLIM